VHRHISKRCGLWRLTQEQPLTKAAKRRKEGHVEPIKKDKTIDDPDEEPRRFSDRNGPAGKRSLQGS
jgi:hypothetical protein